MQRQIGGVGAVGLVLGAIIAMSACAPAERASNVAQSPVLTSAEPGGGAAQALAMAGDAATATSRFQGGSGPKGQGPGAAVAISNSHDFGNLVIQVPGCEQAVLTIATNGVTAEIYVAGDNEPKEAKTDFEGLDESFEPNEWIPGPDGLVYIIGKYGADSGAAISLQLIKPPRGFNWHLLSQLVLEDSRLRYAHSLVHLRDKHYAAVSVEQEVLVVDMSRIVSDPGAAEYVMDPLYVSGASSLRSARGQSRPDGFDLLVLGTVAPGSDLPPDVQAFLYFDKTDEVRAVGRDLTRFKLTKEIRRQGRSWEVLEH